MYGIFGALGYGEASAGTGQPDPSRQAQGLRPMGSGGHRARAVASSIFGGAVYEYSAAERPVSLQPALVAPTGGTLALGMVMPPVTPEAITERIGRRIPITHQASMTLPISTMAPRRLPITQQWPGVYLPRAVPAQLPIGGGVSYQGFGGLTGFGS